MLKHFFKKNTKKQANQTAFAGIEKKNIQEWAQRYSMLHTVQLP